MQTLLLANEFVRRGIETHIILHRAGGEFLGELEPCVHVHDLGIEHHALLPVIALRLNRALSQFPSGQVIVKLWSSILAIQPAARRQRQLEFAIYEDLDPSEHWQFIRFGRLKRALIKPVFRRSRVILANTERVSESMMRAYSLSRRPPVLYCGIDVARIRALAGNGGEAWRAPDATAPIKVVTVASLRNRKGHPRILEALRALERPWRWDVIGDGPEASALRRHVPRDVADRVFFHGALSNPYPHIRSADVLVHLPHSEAFGLVVLEALALGVPVVTSPCIGPREIAATIDPDGLYIRFVDPSDPDEVSRSIELLSTPRADQVPLCITDPFTIARAAERWIGLSDGSIAAGTQAR